MSLRKEIKDSLNNFFGELEGIDVLEGDKDIHIKYTDQILNLFEKRIDEHLKRVKKYDHYSTFALTELKKDMLK